MNSQAARLVFADGSIFRGRIFAKGESCIGEVVFNTAMVGYQEILTDPSYKGQMVVMTYPMIGNYGINEEDAESKEPHIKALLVKEYIDFPSNWRKTQTLKEYLEKHKILGVEGLDTRAITKYLRQFGAAKALLSTSNSSIEQLILKLKTSSLAANVWAEGNHKSIHTFSSPKKQLKVAVVDSGVKQSILRNLRERGCTNWVLPYTVSAKEILAKGFDGVLLSNGPGDPRILKDLVQTVQEIMGLLPIFGICLGHQIMALALGTKIEKLKFGHHGINHPVRNLQSNRVEITSQNHNYIVVPESIDSSIIAITHFNLLDNTIAGIRHKHCPAFSVQFHPEAAPGPLDTNYLFDDFVKMMRNFTG